MRIWLAAILFAAAIAGCHKQASSADSAAAQTNQIAVVDMAQVAKDLGWFEQLQANVNTLNNRMHDQVGETGKNYDDVIRKVETGFKPQANGKLSPEQQQTIVEMTAFAQRIINQLQSASKTAIEGYSQNCLNEYRKALSLLVKDVATAHKITVVIDKSDTMLFYDSTVDLTSAVSAAARENTPVLDPVPLPTLPRAPALTPPTATHTVPNTAP